MVEEAFLETAQESGFQISAPGETSFTGGTDSRKIAGVLPTFNGEVSIRSAVLVTK
ncbi:hypothetical protein ACSAZK_09280 [Methanosarcina sp. Mfa9]|uniref:hypothetical protein n=1 Tax=Methanosarcina sp. Mfa9 TaxID=3439063 RepID=UPI003F87E3A6